MSSLDHHVPDPKFYEQMSNKVRVEHQPAKQYLNFFFSKWFQPFFPTKVRVFRRGDVFFILNHQNNIMIWYGCIFSYVFILFQFILKQIQENKKRHASTLGNKQPNSRIFFFAV